MFFKVFDHKCRKATLQNKFFQNTYFCRTQLDGWFLRRLKFRAKSFRKYLFFSIKSKSSHREVFLEIGVLKTSKLKK